MSFKTPTLNNVRILKPCPAVHVVLMLNAKRFDCHDKYLFKL